MNEIISGIMTLGIILSFISYGIGFYMNFWIYYSADKDKFPFFPILSPLSFSTYELMLNSIFKLSWKVEGENKKLKLKSNNFRKFSGIILLIIIATGILSLIIT
tara:strand:+ start:63 stop:374 length:312 start_codon:yes stop_codon:yes gene_type:complete